MKFGKHIAAIRRRAGRAIAASRNRWIEANYDPFRMSYSQCGEDLIIDYFFASLGRRVESYLDIGAHDPYRLSNTMRFYNQGARGVCVEPDPELAAVFKKCRPRDVCVETGVGATAGTARFYLMTPSTLNTFSREIACELASTGRHAIREEIEVPVTTIDRLITGYFDSAPQLVSIDVEGLDFELIQSMDLEKHRPIMFCVESARYSPFDLGRRTNAVSSYLSNAEYDCLANTFINSVFVDRRLWRMREEELAKRADVPSEIGNFQVAAASP